VSRVTDGATLRQQRIVDMLTMLKNAKGATTMDIQGFMLARHGLKFDTTAAYIKETWLAGLIIEDQGKWVITRKLDRLFGSMTK